MWNQFKTVLLLGAMSSVVVGIGAAMGSTGMLVCGALAVFMNIGAYYFSDRLILSMHGAREVTAEEAPELHAMVSELAATAMIPMPKVCIIPESYANAFATGRNPEHGVVAVTEGILQMLTTRELRGVIAHEIAHIKNRDILIATIASMLGATITYIANLLQFASFFGGSSDDEGESSPNVGPSLLMAFVAPIVATLMQMAVSRAREYVADATAAELTGDPEALALALQRLHEPEAQEAAPAMQPATASLFIVSPLFGMGGFSTWFSTHPDPEDRIERLMAMEEELCRLMDVSHEDRRHQRYRELFESA